jgi:hypothetical protein
MRRQDSQERRCQNLDWQIGGIRHVAKTRDGGWECASAIPTQIFFDMEGKEVYRHVGFTGEEAIVAQMKNMGVA